MTKIVRNLVLVFEVPKKNHVCSCNTRDHHAISIDCPRNKLSSMVLHSFSFHLGFLLITLYISNKERRFLPLYSSVPIKHVYHGGTFSR